MNEKQNLETFRTNLFETLRQSGIADKLKSQLRAKLVSELTTSANMYNEDKIISLSVKVIDSLIIGYLKSRNFEFTLPECGIKRPNQVLTNDDILQILHLNNFSSLFSRTLKDIDAKNEPNKSLLSKLFLALSLSTSIPTINKDTQTFLEPEHLLDWKIHQHHQTQRERSEDNKLSAMKMEERMLRYQHEVDQAGKLDLEARLDKFREIELATVRVEERKRYNSEIGRLKLDYEKKLVDFREKENGNDELERRRQNFELRTKLLEESKRTALAEMAGKTEAELFAKELKLEKDSLERKYAEAMHQVSELNKMKERYADQMHENMTRYKIDLNKEHSNLLSGIQIDRNKIESIITIIPIVNNKGEKVVLEERRKVADQLMNQANNISEEVDLLRSEVKLLKSELFSSDNERSNLKDKIKDLELKVNVQHSSTGLEFELQSLKRQLFSSEKSAQSRQEEYQALIMGFINQQNQITNKQSPAILPIPEKEVLEREVLKWQKECQNLISKLDFEIVRNEELLKENVELKLNSKELRRDLTEMRLLVNQQARDYGVSEYKNLLRDPLETLHNEAIATIYQKNEYFNVNRDQNLISKSPKWVDSSPKRDRHEEIEIEKLTSSNPRSRNDFPSFSTNNQQIDRLNNRRHEDEEENEKLARKNFTLFSTNEKLYKPETLSFSSKPDYNNSNSKFENSRTRSNNATPRPHQYETQVIESRIINESSSNHQRLTSDYEESPSSTNRRFIMIDIEEPKTKSAAEEIVRASSVTPEPIVAEMVPKPTPRSRINENQIIFSKEQSFEENDNFDFTIEKEKLENQHLIQQQQLIQRQSEIELEEAEENERRQREVDEFDRVMREKEEGLRKEREQIRRERENRQHHQPVVDEVIEQQRLEEHHNKVITEITKSEEEKVKEKMYVIESSIQHMEDVFEKDPLTKKYMDLVTERRKQSGEGGSNEKEDGLVGGNHVYSGKLADFTSTDISAEEFNFGAGNTAEEISVASTSDLSEPAW